MANGRRDAAKERLWREALRRCAASGLSVRSFCQRETLGEASFYAWRRTIAERDRQVSRPARANPAAKPEGMARRPAFLPLVVNDTARQDGAISIELAGGRVLRLPETIAATRLAEIIAALDATSELATARSTIRAAQVQR